MIASNDSRGWAQSGTIRQSGDYTHHFTQWKKGGSFEHHTFIHYQHLFGGEVHQYWSPYLTSCNCIAMRVETSQYATTDFNPNGYWAGPWLTEYAGEVTVDGSDVPGNPTDRVGFGHMQSQSSTTTWEPQQSGIEAQNFVHPERWDQVTCGCNSRAIWTYNPHG